MLGGVYLRFGDALDRGVNTHLQTLARALLASPLPGVTDVIASYTSVYLEFDPRHTNARRVRAWVASHEGTGTRRAARTVLLKVRYDGPDLPEVAARTGLSVGEVVRRHSEPLYHVYAVGFTPGLAFMGELESALELPRRKVPRASVPPSSVAIAGAQTTVYPVASPGGWHLLGRTLERVYSPHRSPPLRLNAGDSVRFVPSRGAPKEDELKPLELLPKSPHTPLLRVLQPGLLDLVQDAGRFLAGAYGYARSGPLDARSAALANRLVGNPPGAALLELNLRGGLYEVLEAGVLAFAGYGMMPTLNGEALPPFTSFAVRRGERLGFVPRPRGSRGYLALAGGLESRRFLESAAVDLRGSIGRPLRAGDVLGVDAPRAVRPGRSFVPYGRPQHRTAVRLLPGPQASEEALGALLSGVFEVGSADRMGVRLSGAPVPGGEVRSEGVPIGSVQVPPGGDPIVLLADRGTVGGYSKPARVHPADLWRAGQLRPGDALRFVWAA